MFPWKKHTKYSQTNYMNIFSSSDIANSYYITSRHHCSEKNKKSTSLHTNDETIIVRCFAGFFCIFVLLTSSSLYLSLEICFPGICLMFYLSIFDVTLNLCFLVSFSEIFFLERSRYLFNNAYVRSSLVIIYPYQ